MKIGKFSSICILLLVVLVCCLIFSLINRSISSESENVAEDYYYKTELKLASVFGRHGDRAPCQTLPQGDKHENFFKDFWPNGVGSLTEAGKLRQYRLGVALRRRYALRFDKPLLEPTSLLVFSSKVDRCKEAAEKTLRGFYALEQSKDRGAMMAQQFEDGCFDTELRPLQRAKNMPQSCTKQSKNTGFPWSVNDLSIDFDSIPTLNSDYLDNCNKTLDTSPIDKDLMASPSVAKISGVEQLKEQLKKSYDLDFTYDCLKYYSTILSELRIERTRDTIHFLEHCSGWINKRIEINESSLPEKLKNVERIKLPTLLDVYEAVSLYAKRDRIPEGQPSRMQLGPILSSLIDSQQVALKGLNGQKVQADNSNRTMMFIDEDKVKLYKNKHMVFYFTHDTILQLLMFRIGLIRESDSYLEQFVRAHGEDIRRQFVSGLRKAEFGMTLIFELHEMKMYKSKNNEPEVIRENASNGSLNDENDNTASSSHKTAVKSFAYVQALLYYEEDPVHKPIEFGYLELGVICNHLFKQKYPESKASQIFYDQDFIKQSNQFDSRLNCPYELFRNVTMADYAVNSDELKELQLQMSSDKLKNDDLTSTVEESASTEE